MTTRLLLALPRWQPASNGAGKRHWFLYRDESVPVRDRYYFGASGQLIRYASVSTAQRAADKLNGAELNLAAYLAVKEASERLVDEWASSGTYTPGDPEPQDVKRASARVDDMKKAAGEGGPDEPLCCQRYSRLHHPVFSLPGCRWFQMETTS